MADKYGLLFKLNFILIDIMGIILRFKRIPYTIKNKKTMQGNINLRFHKNHDTCYVIGNGPSLLSVDLSKINGDIMVTNRFYEYKEARSIAPDFYFLVDDLYYSEPLIDHVLKATEIYQNTKFILNGLYKNKIDRKISKDISNYYLYMWGGNPRTKKEIDCTRIIPTINNVVGVAISVALYLRYDRIILLGCDFTSFTSPKETHCYDEEKNDEKQISLAYELFNYALVAESHSFLNKYAGKRGIKILNATKGSLIDAYERIPSEDLEK